MLVGCLLRLTQALQVQALEDVHTELVLPHSPELDYLILAVQELEVLDAGHRQVADEVQNIGASLITSSLQAESQWSNRKNYNNRGCMDEDHIQMRQGL